MIRSTENQREKRRGPSAGRMAALTIQMYVLKETEEADYYEASRVDNYEKMEKVFDEEFDGFKMILYLCSRHDSEFSLLTS